jgi:hypothetical protein
MSSGKRIKNILQTEKYLPEKESNGKKNFQELKGRQKGIREREALRLPTEAHSKTEESFSKLRYQKKVKSMVR